MSTYYYLICDKHKERTDAASWSCGGIGALADSPHTLMPFIVTHHGCPVRIVNEHEREGYEDDFTEWTEQNVDDMVALERDPPLAGIEASAVDDVHNLQSELMANYTALPRHGTPAADLTERDKLALAIAAGAPTETVMDGTKMTVRTTVPVGIADRGDGGYIVAIGRAS